jgi:pimeloyl-ACP methyl ester carboxylesterase
MVRLGRRLETRYSMYWMVRSYHFTALQAQGRTPDLEQRLNEQAVRLADRLLADTDDEVLVVGHSSGAIMAAIVVARALALRPDLLGGGRRISLLTLGQWLPLLGLLPMANAFRAELAVLAAEPSLDWVDFSAPPDGCCFALCDPLQACGVATDKDRCMRFKLLNPRFADMFDSAAYRALKKDRFELHFQYLKVSPRPVDYNYFDITAGPLRLWDRFVSLPGVVDYSGLKPFARKAST